MQYCQLSKGARHHIKADLLPQRVALQTKIHQIIVALRFLLLFLSIFAAVIAVFDDSIFYAVMVAVFSFPCLFCWLSGHYLVLDAVKGEAYIEPRFANRAGSVQSMDYLKNVKIAVQPIPSMVTHYQVALCGQRYTIGTLTDTLAAARFLAQHFDCQLSVKKSVSAEAKTISLTTNGEDVDIDDAQHQFTGSDLRVGRDLYFWDKTSLAKFILIPFFVLTAVGLVIKEINHVF